MDKQELRKKYGDYNKDGYFIIDHEKWHFYAQNPKLYKRNKIKAWLFMLIPVSGIVGFDAIFGKMGLCQCKLNKLP